MITDRDILFATVAVENGFISKQTMDYILKQDFSAKYGSLVNYMMQKKVLSTDEIVEIQNVCVQRSLSQGDEFLESDTTEFLNVNNANGLSPTPQPQPFPESFVDDDETIRDDEICNLAGSSFAHYQLEKELGRGGMGVVYKAKDTKLNRIVALKLLSSRHCIDERMLQRFTQEAKATAQLKHPNIINVFEVGEKPQSYFTMEYMEGETLEDVLKKKNKIPLKEVAIICEKVAEALHTAHKKGIIHRDIKPANIMLTKKGEPKIMDFGLAKLLHSSYKISKPGDMIGTPTYMPPEQAAGKSIDGRCDVYALGATLYEMITGRPPFQDTSYYKIVEKVFNEKPISPREIKPEIPDDLEAICLKSLEKEPEKRYSSARMQAKDLKNFIENRLVLARPGSKVNSLRKTLWRHKFLVVYLLTILVLGLVMVGGYKVLDILHVNKTSEEEALWEGQRKKSEQIIVEAKKQVEKYKKQTVAALAKVKEAEKKAQQEKEISKKTAKTIFKTLNQMYWDRRNFLQKDPRLILSLKHLFVELGRIGVLNPLLDSKDKEGKDILWLYGALYGASQNPLEAEAGIATFDKIIAKQPTARAYIQRGELFLTQKQHQKAMQDFSKAIELNPTDPRSFYYQGLIHAQFRRHKEALAAFSQVVNITPHFPQAYFARGNIYMEQGNFSLAKKDFEHAIKLAPNNFQLYTVRGVLYSKTKQKNKALSDFARAIALNPTYHKTYIYRGSFFIKLKRYRKALLDLKYAIKIFPQAAEAYFHIARLFKSQNKLSGALTNVNKAIEIYPQYFNAYLLRAQLFADQKQFVKAQQDISKALTFRSSGKKDLYKTYGYVYKAKGDFGKALQAYKKALTIDPNDANVCNRIARIQASSPLAKIRDPQQALVLVKKAISLNKNYLYFDTMAMGYAQLKQFDKAVAIQKKVVSKAKREKSKLLPELLKRLRLYEAKRPYIGK